MRQARKVTFDLRLVDLDEHGLLRTLGAVRRVLARYLESQSDEE
jgi:hypothetical protein